MAPYHYLPLAEPTRDIRLIDLLPGHRTDDIVVSIRHASLMPYPPKKPKRPSLKELENTLPPEWMVRENLEGRRLFIRPISLHNWHTTWKHPDGMFGPELQEEEIVDSRPMCSLDYDALSYVWGSPDNPVTVFVRPTENTDALFSLQIQRSLAVALRALRYHDKARTLWVDALCINQSDTNERDVQITRMADIYSLAPRVVVWLGPRSLASTLALSTLNYLGQQVEVTADRYYVRSPTATEPEWYNFLSELPYPMKTWFAILDLTKLTWFDRLWIVQEIHLANPTRTLVQCGTDVVPWRYLRRALLCLSEKKPGLVPLRELSAKLDHIWYLGIPPHALSIRGLFNMSATRLCTDPRDKVYGLLGLATMTNLKVLKKIRPNYDAPVAVVYTNVFRTIFEATRSLELLIQCGSRNSSDHVTIPHLPSWVPNFNIPFQRITETITMSGSFAAAATKGDAVLRCNRDALDVPSILEVSAVRIAGVVHSVEKPPVADEMEELSGRVLNWVRAAQSLYVGDHSCYPTGEPVVDALCLTLCQGMTDTRLPFDCLSTSFLDLKADFLNFVRNPSHDVLQRPIMALAEHNHFQDHAFVTTDLGYFGVANTDTRVGDVICVILGCLSPIILRPMPTENVFQVVGCCYIHGFSDGEAILGPVPAPWQAVLRPADDDDTNGLCVQFRNTITGKETSHDPRIPQLPREWESIQASADSNANDRVYRNKVTGEETICDPRMTVQALECRGLNIERIQLV